MSRVRYHLRVCLSPEHSRAEERALHRYIDLAKIDEVMFFVPHIEENSPGLGTAKHNEACRRMLEPIFKRLRQRGVVPSINVFWTVGFSHFPSLPRDLTRTFKRFRWAVGIDGRKSKAIACPQDPAWRDWVATMYADFASLKPARLWLDDDVRMTLRADLHTPCFCEACCAAVGLGRAKLAKAIMADPQNPVRNRWLAFQERLQREVVQMLADAVHGKSAGTQIGLMFSPLEMHWAEGRRWGELLKVTGKPTYVRPGIGPYNEATAVDLAAGLGTTRLTQAALPDDVIIAPEIETYPGTRFAKSSASIRMNLIMAQLMGIGEMTFGINRHAGRLDLEIEREDTWHRMLGHTKPMLESIAALGITRDEQRGVSLTWHEDVARHVRGVADAGKPIWLFRERPLDTALPLLGIATCYGPGDVAVITGEQIACYTDPELRDLFRRGVLLDARAAETLIHRGQGKLAGVSQRVKDASVVTERDAAGEPMSCRWMPAAWQFRRIRGVKVLSTLHDYDGRVTGHGLLTYTNRLGGRVAILPYDSQSRGVSTIGVTAHPLTSPSFLTWTRQSQFRSVLEWLAGRPLPLVVEGSPCVYPLLIDQGERQIVGVANLSPDPIATLSLKLPSQKVARVDHLQPDGRWQQMRAKIRREWQGVSIATDISLAYLDVAVLQLR